MTAAYDVGFLGPEVVVPEPQPAIADDLVVVDGSTRVDYAHYSLAMSRARRLARWVAWNIDGLALFPGDSIPRDDQEFKLDPRLRPEDQTGEAVYTGNDLDRGHLARRADLLWGTLADAQKANSDSFYFTNITPQMNDFNQSFRHGLWGLLENAILEQSGLEKRRVSVFAGPILTDDDVPYRGTLVPKAFWKVLVYVLDADLRASAFVLQQKVDPGPTIDLGEFAPYQVDLLDLEERTQLTHPALEVLPTASRRMPGGRLLESLAGVEW